jgi:hypothetical protein
MRPPKPRLIVVLSQFLDRLYEFLDVTYLRPQYKLMHERRRDGGEWSLVLHSEVSHLVVLHISLLSSGPANNSSDLNQNSILPTGNYPLKTAQHSAGAWSVSLWKRELSYDSIFFGSQGYPTIEIQVQLL